VPTAVWTDIGLDFVEALPRVGGKSVILTVVDRFSKYCHFIPLGHPYTAESVAQAFFAKIVRLHGVPQSMVSDRDPVFTSVFWQELMRLIGAKIHMTSAFHPQSDGQTEAANKVITMYLRCFTGDRPRQWLRWLPWAEYIYNTAYQSALHDTPFRVVYGRDPPSIRSYEPGDTRVAAIAKSMAERDEFLADVRLRLEQAQAVYKRHYDKHHREVHYKEGDWVWLRLRQRAAASLHVPTAGKLKPRYYGPYRVVAVINEVAYQLELPPRARLHNVFHVSLFEAVRGHTAAGAAGSSADSQRCGYAGTRTRPAFAFGQGGSSALGSLEGRASCFGNLGGRRQLHRPLPAFPARGRAACRGRERCYVGTALSASVPHTGTKSPPPLPAEATS
jgi:hypothetical protein